MPVAEAQLKRGCYARFEIGHARGDIDRVLYKRWQAKRVQALRCNKLQRENGTKERYVAQQRALEEDMDRELASARSKRIEEVGNDTNARVRVLEDELASLHRKVESTASHTTDMHTVMIKGESIGGSGIARKAQIRLAKASLTTEFQAASSASKDEMLEVMQARVDRLKQLSAETVEARRAAFSGDESLLLSLAPLFAEAKAKAKATAKRAPKAKAAAKRAAVAKPQQRTLDAGFDLD